MNKLNSSLLLIVILIALPLSFTISQPDKNFDTVFNETRGLTHDGQRIEACDLFESVGNAQSFIQNEEVNRQEMFLYERAQLFLDVADELSNINEKKKFAEKSCDYWREYIEWYHSLKDSSKSLLNTANRRIIQSTALYGNAIVLYDPLKILNEFINNVPDLTYLAPDAIDKWCSWLYRCPELREVRMQDRARVRREKICNEDFQDYWLDFADFEERWANSFNNLSSSSKNYYLRDASRIKNEYENCQ